MRRLKAALVGLALALSVLMPVAPSQASTPLWAWRPWILQRINTERALHGVPPLRYCLELQTDAQVHAHHMANRGAIYHGDFPSFGSGWIIGQNVGVGPEAHDVEVAFEHSAPHLANEVSRDYTVVGIGIVYQNGDYWIVQDFRG